MDWVRWHAEYDDAASPLAQRLRVVQEQIRGVLDRRRSATGSSATASTGSR
jgi:hypothetical protein